MDPWRIQLAAVFGIMTGVITATVWQFTHDHVQFRPDELISHFVPELIAAIMGCAVLFVTATILWSRLKQRR